MRRSEVQSVFQFIPQVEIKALCRTLEFFYSASCMSLGGLRGLRVKRVVTYVCPHTFGHRMYVRYFRAKSIIELSPSVAAAASPPWFSLASADSRFRQHVYSCVFSLVHNI